jgi:predicted DNA-binding transcriptional regulator AlpA
MATSTDQFAELARSTKIAVDERLAADIISLSHDTLRRYRRQGTGPRFCRIGGPNGVVRYLVADLISWLQQSTFQSRGDELARGGA